MKLFTVLIFLAFFSFRATSNWLPAIVEQSHSPFAKDNTGMIFMGLDCADSQNCIAIANDNFYYRVIYRCSDGGKNWKMVFKPDYDKYISNALLRSISYPSLNKCIVGADSGYIFLSNDTGKTWNQITTPIKDYLVKNPNYRTINSVKMLDSNYGVACTQYFILYTKNGGNSWEVIQKPDSNLYIWDATLLSSNSIIFYGLCQVKNKDCPFYETMFVSENLGKSWSNYNFCSIDSLTDFKSVANRRLYFVDSLNGWVSAGERTGVGDKETEKIAVTYNGGKTWTLLRNQLGSTNFPIVDYSFHDKSNGIITTKTGGISWTHDGGITWINDSIPNRQAFLPPNVFVCYRNVNYPIIADYNGRIFYWNYETSVDDINKNFGDIIYPNPTSDQLNINSNQSIDKIRIYSILGMKVLETEWQEKINVSGLAPGVYFIKVGDKMSKFVKI